MHKNCRKINLTEKGLKIYITLFAGAVIIDIIKKSTNLIHGLILTYKHLENLVKVCKNM